MTEMYKANVVREAVAVFFDGDSMQKAASELQRSGFEKKEISLLAGDHAIKRWLRHVYDDTNEDASEPGAPRTAFVARESVGDAVNALSGTLFFTGATVASGAVVATAGVLGSAVTAGAAGVAALGGIAAVAASFIKNTEAESLREEIDRGHLVLFVRTPDGASERRALDILLRHSGADPHIVEIRNDKGPAE